MALAGKIIWVTGAGQGIGRGIATVCIEQGATVAVTDVNLETATATATALGENAFALHCDVADEASVNATLAAVLARCGRLDVLVNNAGVNFEKPFETTSVADWDRIMGVDLRGVFLCTRACVTQFLAQESGNVVSIASVHSIAGYPGSAPYDAAKWGIVGMTKALAVEYARRGLRFNCVSPGLIFTEIWHEMRARAASASDAEAFWMRNIPMDRAGAPREIGDAVAYLASDAASYVTGTNLVVDGGMTSALVSRREKKA